MREEPGKDISGNKKFDLDVIEEAWVGAEGDLSGSQYHNNCKKYLFLHLLEVKQNKKDAKQLVK